MSKLRLFVAVNLPIPVVKRLGDEIKRLQPLAREAGLQVAWVAPANIHVTVKFLGPVDEVHFEGIRDKLRKGVAAHAPFDLEARGLGAFPDVKRPRVIWIGLKEQPALAALARDVEAGMEALGFPKEERAFHPHLTLGRVKGGSGSLESALARDVIYGSGLVTELVLYESRMQRSGAEYHALARLPLGKAEKEISSPTEPFGDTASTDDDKAAPDLPGSGGAGGA